MQAIKGSPVGLVAAYEYGQALLSQVNEAHHHSKDNLPNTMSLDACKSTQLSDILFGEAAAAASQNTKSSRHDFMEMEVPHADRMKEFVSGLLSGRTFIEEDTNCHPGLLRLHDC